MRRWAITSAQVLAIVAALLVSAWGALALALRLPGPAWLAEAVGVLFLIGAAALLIWVRPLRRAFTWWALGLAIVGVWWSTIRPSNERQWVPEVAQVATAEVQGDRLIVHNVRDFDYRSETEFTEHWENRTYDLAGLRGVDLFLSHWGVPMIAHTIMSWEFADGQHLAISIETRRERGEAYSALRGFFRQYELYYVVADERDVIRVRTNYRGEDVYLYRLRAGPEIARALLLDYVDTINALAERPQFYNALTDNCTTGIRVHAQRIKVARSFDYRILANGTIDELLYERGQVDTSHPFADLRAASLINSRAQAADASPDFSQRIRSAP